MKKQLYIHIGAPATGTTSIQHFMMLNRDKWAEEGVGIYSKNNIIPDPEKDWFFSDVWVNFRNVDLNDFLLYANDYDTCHSYIVSDEFLFRNHSIFTPGLWEKLKYRFNVNIIIYLRRLDDASLAMWKWHTKFLWSHGEYFPQKNVGTIYWNEKYVIERILRVLPNAKIIVRSFAYPKFDNLILDFVDACGCTRKDWDGIDRRYNTNPTMDVAYALLYLKKEHGLHRINPQFYNGLTDAAMEYSRENPDNGIHPWTYKERYKFCQTKSEITKWTEENYFNGDPLYKPIIEADPWVKDEDKIKDIANTLYRMALQRNFIFPNTSLMEII